MKKILLLAALAIGAVAQFVSAQVNGTAAKPLVSTIDKPVYYYIESAYDGTTGAKPATGPSSQGMLLYSQVTDNVIAKYDLYANIADLATTGLWRLEASGANVKIINVNGRYLKTSVNPTQVSSTASTDLNIIGQLGTTSQYTIKLTNQNPVVAWYSAGNGNYLDRYSSQGVNSRSAWYFIVAPGSETNYNELYTASFKADLATKITATQAVLTNTSEGTNIGQFSAGARTTLSNAISAAQTAYDNPSSTVENYQTSIANLETAKWAYLATGVTPLISDGTTTRWYFLQGTRPANSYMTSTGSKAAILGKTVIPDDTQLWKFVANPRGTANGFSMVNKATGEYLSANTPYNTNIFSIDTVPTNNLKFIVSDIFTNGSARIWIENAAGSTPVFRLHAGNSNVMNWNGNAYDNSSWLILDYNTALRVFLQTAITNAQTLLAATTQGADFGQYSSTNRNTLSSAIATAQAVYNDNNKTTEEIIAATTAMNTAITDYKSTINSNTASLLSSTQGMYRWYWIRSYATNSNATYAFGKVISQGIRAVGDKFTFEPKVTDPKPNPVQLFRFETTIDGKIANIIDGLGNVMAATGAISTTPTDGNDFTLTPLTDGVAFWIKPTSLDPIHAQEAGSHIVNWNNTAGSASAWVFDYAMETTVADATALKNTETQGYRINTLNHTITVEGVNNFEVYSVTGQKQNRERALQSGIYFVKIGDLVQKVMVK